MTYLNFSIFKMISPLWAINPEYTRVHVYVRECVSAVFNSDYTRLSSNDAAQINSIERLLVVHIKPYLRMLTSLLK